MLSCGGDVEVRGLGFWLGVVVGVVVGVGGGVVGMGC